MLPIRPIAWSQPEVKPNTETESSHSTYYQDLKPDRVVTREINGDSIDSMSFLNHASTKDVDPSKPLPKTSDDKHVLEVYYIDNIANLPAHLKDILVQQKNMKLKELEGQIKSIESSAYDPLGETTEPSQDSSFSKDPDSRQPEDNQNIRKKRGFSDDDSGNEDPSNDPKYDDKATEKVIDLLMKQENEKALAIMKRKGSKLNPLLRRNGYTMSDAVAASGKAHVGIVDKMIELKILTFNPAIAIKDTSSGELHIVSTMNAIVESRNSELLNMLTENNGRRAKQVAERDSSTLRDTSIASNAFEFALKRGHLSIAMDLIRIHKLEGLNPFDSGYDLMYAAINTMETKDQAFIQSALKELCEMKFSSSSLKQNGIDISASEFNILRGPLLLSMSESKHISADVFKSIIGDMDLTSGDGIGFAIHEAVKHGNQNMLEAIESTKFATKADFKEYLKAASLNEKNINYNIVADAAASGNSNFVNLLLDSGCRVEKGSSSKLITPMDEIIAHGTPEMVRGLLGSNNRVDLNRMVRVTKKGPMPEYSLAPPKNSKNVIEVNLLNIALLNNKAILPQLFMYDPDGFMQAFNDVRRSMDGSGQTDKINAMHDNFNYLVQQIYSPDPKVRNSIVNTKFWDSVSEIAIAEVNAHDLPESEREAYMVQAYKNEIGEKLEPEKTKAYSNDYDLFGITPLTLAIIHKDQVLSNILIKFGAYVNSKSDNIFQVSNIELAARNGLSKVVVAIAQSEDFTDKERLSLAKLIPDLVLYNDYSLNGMEEDIKLIMNEVNSAELKLSEKMSSQEIFELLSGISALEDNDFNSICESIGLPKRIR